MKNAATRVGVASSVVFFLIWSASWLSGDILSKSFQDSDFLRLVRSTEVFVFLPAFGVIGLMIFGMNYHFVPLFSGRRLWSPTLALASIVLADAAVAGLLLSRAANIARLSSAFLTLWLLVCILFVGNVFLTLSGSRTVPRQASADDFRRSDRLSTPMLLGSTIYLILAGTGFVLTSLTETGHSIGLALTFPSALHLYTLGFVSLMIFGVASHLFPRFLKRRPPEWSLVALNTLALIGPMGVALTIGLGGPWFTFFAGVEGGAALLFALMLWWLYLGSEKRRPAFVFALVSVSALSAGVILGVLFSIYPTARALVDLHARLNLLAFAGFMILSVTHEIIPPYSGRGYALVRRATRFDATLAILGLSVYGISKTWELVFDANAWPFVVLGSLMLMVLVVSYTIGTLWSLRTLSESPQVMHTA